MKKGFLVAIVGIFLFAACSQPGSDTQLPAVSDGSYTILDSNEPEVTYQWYDITAGTRVTLSDEAFSASQVPIEFDFSLFGTNANWAYIHSNGFITLQNSVSGNVHYPAQVPDYGGVQLIIAGYWADLDPSAGGNIYYETIGTGPNRIFIVSYEEIPFKAVSSDVTFQIALYETTNLIQIQYSNFETDSKKHTLGVEDASGSRGSFPTGMNYTDFIIADEYAVQFTPVP